MKRTTNRNLRSQRPCETPRWRVIATAEDKLWCVLADECPKTLAEGERVVWEGEAPYLTAAYRAARNQGAPIYCHKSGEFRLRKPRVGS